MKTSSCILGALSDVGDLFSYRYYCDSLGDDQHIVAGGFVVFCAVSLFKTFIDCCLQNAALDYCCNNITQRR